MMKKSLFFIALLQALITGLFCHSQNGTSDIKSYAADGKAQITELSAAVRAGRGMGMELLRTYSDMLSGGFIKRSADVESLIETGVDPEKFSLYAENSAVRNRFNDYLKERAILNCNGKYYYGYGVYLMLFYYKSGDFKSASNFSDLLKRDPQVLTYLKIITEISVKSGSKFDRLRLDIIRKMIDDRIGFFDLLFFKLRYFFAKSSSEPEQSFEEMIHSAEKLVGGFLFRAPAGNGADVLIKELNDANPNMPPVDTGKPALLVFVNPRCKTCVSEITLIKSINKNYAGKMTVALVNTLNKDDETMSASYKSLAGYAGKKLPIYNDRGNAAALTAGVTSLSSIIFIREGKMRRFDVRDTKNLPNKIKLLIDTK